MQNHSAKDLGLQDLLKDIFKKAEGCRLSFVERKPEQLNQLDADLDAFINAIEKTMVLHPIPLIMLNNINHNQQQIGSQLIIKTAVLTHVFCQVNGVWHQQITACIKANLIMLFSAMPMLLAIKAEHKKRLQYKNHLHLLAQIACKNATQLHITNGHCLHILKLIAKHKNQPRVDQRIQSIMITSLNTAILSLPILSDKKHSATHALQAQTLQQIINPQPFVSCFLPELISGSKPWLSIGALVNLRDDEYGLIIEYPAVTNEQDEQHFQVMIYKDKTLSELATPKSIPAAVINNLYPQTAVNIMAIMRVFQQLNSDQFCPSSLKLTQTKKQSNNIFVPSGNPKQRASILLTENNKEIISYLLGQPEQAKQLMKYASGKNRTQQQIESINHAIAILGLMRVYPALCVNELKIKQSQTLFLGSSELNNQVDLFGHLASELSILSTVNSSIDVPEYNELLARILFMGLVSMNKSRNVFLKVRFNTVNKKTHFNDLAGYFHIDNTSEWQQACMQLCKQWYVPEVYVAVLTHYFSWINKRVKLSDLPKSQQKLILVLKLSNWLFAQFIRGETDQLLVSNEAVTANDKISNSTLIEIQKIASSLKLKQDLSTLYWHLVDLTSPCSRLD